MTYSPSTKIQRIFVMFAVLLMGATACTTASRPDLTGMSFSSEPLLGKVIWHDLITEDLDSARNFYGELLGWSFENFSGGRDKEYVVARKGDVIVAGLLKIQASTDGENYSRWLPYMSVDDVDAALSRSIAGGASVAVTARNVSLGRVAAIIDPQGAVIGLARTTIGDPDDLTTAAAPGRPVWTELLADDPQAAAAFYGSLANYDARTITRRGGEYTVLASGGVDRVGIFQNPAEGEYTPVWITAFGVNDPVAAAAKAVSLGGTIILPVSAELRDGTTAVVTDPSGAILVLQSWSRAGAE
jgi:predicted enzyme related to lactoylglutathione lyase